MELYTLRSWCTQGSCPLHQSLMKKVDDGDAIRLSCASSFCFITKQASQDLGHIVQFKQLSGPILVFYELRLLNWMDTDCGDWMETLELALNFCRISVGILFQQSNNILPCRMCDSPKQPRPKSEPPQSSMGCKSLEFLDWYEPRSLCCILKLSRCLL